MMVLKPKAIAVKTVKRSRFRSTTLDDAAAEPIPPPNISESPPPLPLCSRIETIRIMHSTIWTEIDIHVITTWLAPPPVYLSFTSGDRPTCGRMSRNIPFTGRECYAPPLGLTIAIGPRSLGLVAQANYLAETLGVQTTPTHQGPVDVRLCDQLADVARGDRAAVLHPYSACDVGAELLR